MALALVFAATLMAAVLISGFAHRSILSTAVLFLAVGFVLGIEPVGALTISATDPSVDLLVQLALFSVLYTDGMRLGVRELGSAWRLPGRALLFGMPLTMLLTAALAHWLVGLDWLHAALLGAVLSPTDPVFASAIVGREEVPYRLRHLLNVESGVNDGLALPVVVALTSIAGAEEVHYLMLAEELIGGVVLGVAVPWLAIKLEGSRFFEASEDYQPINGFAIGLLIFVLANALHQNAFLAAFAGGVTVATVGPRVRDYFHGFGEIITELLKLASLLVFGLLMSLEFLGQTTAWEVVFVLAALLAVRPIALGISLLGSELERREWLAVAWFGPKGFASVVYGLLILREEPPESELLFHLTGLVVAASIIAHSSTDVLVAAWFRKDQGAGADDPPATGSG